jgi:hypothetical protein
MPGDVYPFDPEMPHEERARRAITMLKAGILGEPNGRPQSDPETQRIYFETISRSANADQGNRRPWVFQWRFRDADPWHIVVQNGSTRAERGEAPDPDVVFTTDWEQWIDVTTRGENPLRAIARGRLRPRGSLRGMRVFRRLFTPRSVA